jgi:hypothetical protein
MYIVCKPIDIQGYPVGLDLDPHLCPWILSWAEQSEANGFGFGSGFTIFVQTRSIAIVMEATTIDTFPNMGGRLTCALDLLLFRQFYDFSM